MKCIQAHPTYPGMTPAVAPIDLQQKAMLAQDGGEWMMTPDDENPYLENIAGSYFSLDDDKPNDWHRAEQIQTPKKWLALTSWRSTSAGRATLTPYALLYSSEIVTVKALDRFSSRPSSTPSELLSTRVKSTRPLVSSM